MVKLKALSVCLSIQLMNITVLVRLSIQNRFQDRYNLKDHGKLFLALAMTSQYIGDKVSKSSSSFSWCVMWPFRLFWLVERSAPQQDNMAANKFYQLLVLRAMVNGWENESMTLFVVDRVLFSGLVRTSVLAHLHVNARQYRSPGASRKQNSIHHEKGHGLSCHSLICQPPLVTTLLSNQMKLYTTNR